MIGMIEQLSDLFSRFAFTRYALLVGVLIAFCSALLGVTLVLKRFSFIGNGLSNTAFGATAIGAAIGFNNDIFFVLPVTVFCAILLLCSGQNAKIKGDASLAMISVGALAVGYLIVNKFPPRSANLAGDICDTLFGSILTLGANIRLVYLCVGLSIFVTVMFVLMYNKIFAITFDEDFAAATGTRVKVYNLSFAIIVAVIVVLAMNLVGALLVSALVVFPALTAMRVFKTFMSVTICAVAVSVVSAALGIMLSMLREVGTPTGSTIVVVNIILFGIFSLIGFILRR
jgi:zinc transport system permease protein